MEYFLLGDAGREPRRPSPSDGLSGAAARKPSDAAGSTAATAHIAAFSALAGTRREPRSARSNPKSDRGPSLRHEPDAAYDEIFRRVEGTLRSHRALMTGELAAAGPQWQRLKAQPQARRMVMIANDRRLQTWGLFDHLLEESRQQADSSPQRAAELAQLALAIALRLPAEIYGVERLADFRCTALIELANARRRGGNPAAARVALSQAQIHLSFGTGDLLDQASLAHRRFELHRDEGELPEAFAALERAKSLYRLLGDDRLRGVTLLAYPATTAAGSAATCGAKAGRAPVA